MNEGVYERETERERERERERWRFTSMSTKTLCGLSLSEPDPPVDDPPPMELDCLRFQSSMLCIRVLLETMSFCGSAMAYVTSERYEIC